MSVAATHPEHLSILLLLQAKGMSSSTPKQPKTGAHARDTATPVGTQTAGGASVKAVAGAAAAEHEGSPGWVSREKDLQAAPPLTKTPSAWDRLKPVAKRVPAVAGAAAAAALVGGTAAHGQVTADALAAPAAAAVQKGSRAIEWIEVPHTPGAGHLDVASPVAQATAPTTVTAAARAATPRVADFLSQPRTGAAVDRARQVPSTVQRTGGLASTRRVLSNQVGNGVGGRLNIHQGQQLPGRRHSAGAALEALHDSQQPPHINPVRLARPDSGPSHINPLKLAPIRAPLSAPGRQPSPANHWSGREGMQAGEHDRFG